MSPTSAISLGATLSLAGQWVVARHEEHQFCRVQQLEARIHRKMPIDHVGEVQLAVKHGLGRLAAVAESKRQHRVRMRSQERGNRLEEKILLFERQAGTQPHASAPAVLEVVQCIDERFLLGQHQQRRSVHLMPGCGQVNRALLVDEEVGLKCLLQLPDVVRDGGLPEVQVTSCGRVAVAIDDGDENQKAEQFQIHAMVSLAGNVSRTALSAATRRHLSCRLGEHCLLEA